MYFLRLAKLKPVVEAFSEEAWDGYQVRLDHEDMLEMLAR